ncbi:acetyl esterase/lipase [Deinococcus metalli]|uniref:Esterase n=1 Tax=Deinococcus metalli TaxID=1141878 RepID=A0A7W8KGE0_9DEIO|nr:alpha/beta hydrolase [Deinococcus metalli]MBB5376516.1 acetyl esterase/lipase [Deinococcus metalli]GHF43445.1 esterase [Deinococcus metalli]
MTFHDRVDPESWAVLDAASAHLPADLWAASPVARRQASDALLAAMTAHVPPTETVTWHDQAVPGLPGEPDVPIRIYRPRGADAGRPGVLLIHGGGMWGGSIAHEHLRAVSLADDLNAVVVSVEYRLAPEHPHPAPVRDCSGALTWMASNTDALGVDPSRLVVIGGSAGGGLALGVALMARDQGGPRLHYVMALYPMIDDRSETASAREFDHLGAIWDYTRNVEAWAWYLGGQRADAYAAPARAEQLTGLPPVFIDVGELDVFRDEDVAFALRLMQAGVPTELHVYPGAFHASEFVAPDADLSRRISRTRLEALRRALRPTAAVGLSGDAAHEPSPLSVPAAR